MKTISLLVALLLCSIVNAQNVPHLGTQTPVEFTGLSTYFKDKLSLIWSTASETNNYCFLIKRSNDKGLTWSEVGSVQGHGTTKIKQIYTWTELESIKGEVYYRLIQVDLDGKETELTLIYYDFKKSYYNGLELNGEILSIKKIHDNSTIEMVIIETDKQVYKLLTTYKED